MINLLSKLRNHVIYSIEERKLRGLIADSIKDGTATIEKNEEGHPYASTKAREME